MEIYAHVFHMRFLRMMYLLFGNASQRTCFVKELERYGIHDTLALNCQCPMHHHNVRGMHLTSYVTS
jgi:hypothetical protein